MKEEKKEVENLSNIENQEKNIQHNIEEPKNNENNDENNNNENNNKNDNKNIKKKEKDNRSFSEKTEDAMDGFFGGLQDLMYGPGDNYTEDIPATIEKPNGIREINKVQTRRNFNKRFIFNKTFGKIVLGIFLIAILIGAITGIVALII